MDVVIGELDFYLVLCMVVLLGYLIGRIGEESRSWRVYRERR